MTNSIFKTHPFQDQVIIGQSMPEIKRHLGSFICSGQLTVLFGATGVGKSTVAIQMCKAISEGRGLWGLENEAGASKTLYFDFEHDQLDLNHKYGKMPTEDNFHHSIPEFTVGGWSNDIAGKILSIREEVERVSPSVVFIDNSTAICSDAKGEKDAAQLASGLINMTKELGIACVLISHTPKRPQNSIMEIKDLAGSHVLGDFAQNIIALNDSILGCDERYLVQLKCRMEKKEFDRDNVIVFNICDDNGFPEMKLNRFDSEFNLTAQEQNGDIINSNKAISQRDKAIIALYRTTNYSHKDIAETIGLGKSMVGNILKGLSKDDQAA